MSAERKGHRRDIKVGSVWRSRDRRDFGRTVTVEAVSLSTDYGNGFVVVRSARRSNMRIRTLLERYDLLVAAPEQAS